VADENEELLRQGIGWLENNPEPEEAFKLALERLLGAALPFSLARHESGDAVDDLRRAVRHAKKTLEKYEYG
jgi:hypothetical protein